MKLKSMVKRVLKKVGIIPDKRSAKQAKGAKEKNGATPQELSEAELERLALEAEEKARQEAEKEELEAVIQRYAEFDRDHVWAFVAGNYSQDFRGNPKYLFIYINKYRPDIAAYWLCSDEETIAQVRALGYQAYRPETPAAQYVINRTGVFAAEHVKIDIPSGLEDVKYLNLWHGVGGVKAVERSLTTGRLAIEIAKKYVNRNAFYRTHELYLAPSRFIESIAMEQLGLDEDKIIRAGYPRCLYQKNYERVASFDHDLRRSRQLPEDTRLAAYVPTYRNENGTELFTHAIPDIDRLIEVCEKEHILMVFKMHPILEDEMGFQQAKEAYQDCKWLCFWDNRDDFYEVMDQMDLCIMDYSSIFTDFLSVGVKHFLRYTFDFDNEDLDFPMDYDEATLGRRCRTFEELLAALGDYEKDDLTESIERITKLYWEYSDNDSMERIIEQTIAFVPEKREFPTLYSFDVFDTLISRKVLDPIGIFYYVRERIQDRGGFPMPLIMDYPKIRSAAESVMREFYHKTIALRQSDRVEVTLDEIIARIATTYSLTPEQASLLKEWELRAELENVIPLPEQIDQVKRLLENGDTVVLISDMYLPKDVIEQMLEKADPVLSKLPLFLSNEYGVLKTSKMLYLEVYKSFKPFYDFGQWIHYGDNPRADWNQAAGFGIRVRKVRKPGFKDMHRQLVEELGTYDSYLVAAMQARLCQETFSAKDEFVCSYVSLCMVPYIDWVLRDAVRRGYETLYFISRDGHPLKRVADALIEERGLKIKTKYIYASRRAWRIPSFIHDIDEDFWLGHGNFTDVISKEKLFRAMDLDEETFRRLFPAIDPDAIDFEDGATRNRLVEIFKNSADYREYLLAQSAKERVLVSGYLAQEIDRNEQFAIVEYWGRGYTQDNMVRLWQDIVGEEVSVPFYYTRTTLPTLGSSIRYNFTTNAVRQFFLEGIFANMPYRSVEEYEEKDGKIVPIIRKISYQEDLYESMQKYLPEFARRYARLDLLHPEDTDHMLYDFALNYYGENLTNPAYAEQIGPLIDSVALYGKKREFAPPYTMELLDRFANKEISRGSMKVTTSVNMSVTRSDEAVKKRYFEMYQILPEDENLAGGRLLSEKEIEENRAYQEKYTALSQRASDFSHLYEDAIQTVEISDQILILSEGKKKSKDRMDLLEAGLKKQDRYEVKTLLLGKRKAADDEALAREIASARYLVMPKPISFLAKTAFREGTEAILLPATPFVLYNGGLQVSAFLKWKKKYAALAAGNDFSVIQVPAASRAEYFRKCYGTRSDVRCDLLGNYMTDVYFDDAFRAGAEEKLLRLFPEAAGKKRILYMPRWRTRKSCPEWLDILDMELLRDLIGEEYVVLVWFNKEQMLLETMNTIDVPGFSKLLLKGMMLREMMSASDVIIGDYNDTFFETPIVRKPAFSTAYDYEQVTQSGNMSINANSFEQFLFCPVIRTAPELAEHLKHIDQYDFTAMDAFKEEFLTMCDGHSTERIADYLTENRHN